MTDFEELIAVLGRELGIKLQIRDGVVSFDAVVDVDAGASIGVDLTYLPDGQRILASADLGEQPQKEGVCRALMEANHLFAYTGGATLSVEPESRHVRIEICCPLALLLNDGGIMFLERFLNVAESWRKHLAEPTENTSDIMPHFKYIMA